MELDEILFIHSKKYPLMRECDLVKLVFQNEFGGGHLISDRKASLIRLEAEFLSTEKNSAFPLYEEIGNGMVRVNLASIDTDVISLEQLNDAFVCSAERHKGTFDGFLEKINIVRSTLPELGLGFSLEEFDLYLSDHKNKGCPAVSHSEIYRDNYKPAYRVICRDFLTLY